MKRKEAFDPDLILTLDGEIYLFKQGKYAIIGKIYNQWEIEQVEPDFWDKTEINSALSSVIDSSYIKFNCVFEYVRNDNGVFLRWFELKEKSRDAQIKKCLKLLKTYVKNK